MGPSHESEGAGGQQVVQQDPCESTTCEVKEQSAARHGQKIAGDSSHFRPYSDDEDKVRWLAVAQPKQYLKELPLPPMPPSPSLQPSSLGSPMSPSSRVKRASQTSPKDSSPKDSSPKENGDDRLFSRSFQQVASELGDLCTIVASLGDQYRQELSDLRSENMALSLQIRRLQANQTDEGGRSSALSKNGRISVVSTKSKPRFESENSGEAEIQYPSEMVGRSLTRETRDSATLRGSGLTIANLKSGQSCTTLIGQRIKLRPTWEVSRASEIDEDFFEDSAEGDSRQWNKKKQKEQLRSQTTLFDMTSSHHTHWTMHPHGRYRIAWNLMSLLAITYDIIMIPMDAFGISDVGVKLVCEWMLTIFWTLDVGVTFMTGYVVGSAVERRPHQIAKNYARTWLACDVLLVALEWLSRLLSDRTNFGSLVRSSRIFRILRCIRLIRFTKLRSLMLVIEDKINSTLAGLCLTLLKLIAALIILVHCITCGWYALGQSSSNGWTSYYAPALSGERDVFFWYFASSRWTLAQINGRTDMDERRGILELTYTCIVAVVFAVIFMAVFISSITTTMMELQTMAASQTSTQRLLKEYFAQYNISPRLIVSVKRHIQDFQNAEHGHDNEDVILKLLPRSLAHDLLYEVRAPVITSNMLLHALNQDFPRVIRHVSQAVVTPLPAHKWEIIFDRGDACTRTLFVERGEIIYDMEVGLEWSPDFGDPDAVPPGDYLKKGTCISEAALWMYWENCGRLVAGGQASLLALGAVAFEEHLRDFSVPHGRAALYAKKFFNDMTERAIQGYELTDVERVHAWNRGSGAYKRSISSGIHDKISFWLPARMSNSISSGNDKPVGPAASVQSAISRLY